MSTLKTRRRCPACGEFASFKGGKYGPHKTPSGKACSRKLTVNTRDGIDAPYHERSAGGHDPRRGSPAAKPAGEAQKW